jgi:TP901 family phage tail tape measure protein
MNGSGSQHFDISLSTERLKRDAQTAMQQFNRIGQAAAMQGQRIDAQFASAGKGITGAFTKGVEGAKSALMDLSKNILGISALMSSGSFIKDIYSSVGAFNKQMRIVSTISDDVANNMDNYKNKVLDLCTEIAVAPETAAAALYQINSAGHLGADGMKVLEVSAKSAVGGVTETAVAADAITTILNAYRMKSEEAEAVSDKLFTTVRLGKTTMDELGRSIAYVAPLAATYKISIDEVLGAVAQLTKQGNSTQNAMTQISASITAIANELGDDAFNNGLLAAVENIEKMAGGSNQALKDQLGNIRAVRAALGLAKENASETASMIKEIKNSAGAADAACKKMNTSGSAEMTKLKNNFIKEFASIATAGAGVLGGLAKTLNQAFESGNMQRMLSLLKDIIIVYGIYKGVLIALMAIGKGWNVIQAESAVIKRAAAIHQTSLNTAQAFGAAMTMNLKRAWQALNATMKANMFGIIVGAVAAAAYGIYKLCKYESDAVKQQKRLTDTYSEFRTTLQSEQQELRSLFDALEKTKVGTEANAEARQAIIDKYGNLLANMDTEKAKLIDVAGAYAALTVEIEKAARARYMLKAIEDERTKYDELYQKEYNKAFDLIAGKFGIDYARRNAAAIGRVLEGKTKANPEFLKKFNQDHSLFVDSSPGGSMHNYTTNDLQKSINNVVKAKHDLDMARIKVEGMYGMTEEQANRISNTTLKAPALPDTNKIYAGGNTSGKGSKGGSKGREGGSTDTGSKNPEEQAREVEQADLEIREIERRQAEERAREQEDLEMEKWQRRIDAMDEGEAKTLEQTRLDNQKELQETQRAYEDAVNAEIERQKELFEAKESAKKAENSKYVEKNFKPEDVDKAPIEAIKAQYKELADSIYTVNENAQQRYIQSQTDAMNEYLVQWGKGMEKRNAIKALADSRLAQAQNDGERNAIRAQLNKDLSDFDMDANKKTAAISTMFEDMTERTLADVRAIFEQGQKSIDFLKAGVWDAAKGEELGISEETFKYLSNSPEELERLVAGLKNLKKEIDGFDNGFKKLGKGFSDLFKSGNDPKKFQAALAKITEGMQSVIQVATFLQNSLSQLGEAFGSDTLGDIAQGIGTALEAVNGAMSGAQAGAAFGPWGAAAGAAIGLVSSLGSALAKLHDAKHEKKITELQDEIEVLEEGYNRLGDAIEKAYSKDASNLIDQQNELLKQQKILIQQQINEEKEKKNSDESRIKDWEKQIRDIDRQIADNKEKAIDAIFGEDVKSAIDNFAEAYESMFDGGVSRARASKDLVKQMIKQMIIEAMKADISEPMKRIREMLQKFWEDGYIDANEQGIINRMVEDEMSELENKYGWADGYFKGSTSQGGSKGGFTTMSQDSADELNGRFTALQMAGEVIKTTTLEINEQLRAVAAKSAATSNAVEEIRGLSLIAIDHLERISKHTANLEEMNERLGKIEKYTSRL